MEFFIGRFPGILDMLLAVVNGPGPTSMCRSQSGHIPLFAIFDSLPKF